MNEAHEQNLRVIRSAHPIKPGIPGIKCYAGQLEQSALLTVIDESVCCSECGNELGRSDQLMIRVWHDRNIRSRQEGYAFLAFV